MDVLIRLMNALLMIVIPLGVGVFLIRRWGLGWRILLIGAATFIGSQMLHIPFNLIVLVPIADKLDLISSIQGVPFLLYGLILGLSAGIFEEGARYVVLRVWLRDVRRWKEAVVFGVGHGGIEAILLGGLALYAFFQATAFRDADLSELVSAAQLELARAQLEAYWTAPWYAAILGAVERSMAIVIQISLAVLVFQAVVEKKGAWLIVAVGWHTVVDAVAVYGLVSWGVYVTEGILAIFAAISLCAILVLRRRRSEEVEFKESQVEDIPDVIEPSLPMEIELTKDRLDDSRYNH